MKAWRGFVLTPVISIAAACTSAVTADVSTDCAPGTYGEGCVVCACVNGAACDDGRAGTGACTCAPGTYGATCASTCSCANGAACDDGVTGTGACTCAPGTYGATCASTCSCANGAACDDGVTGTGACTCAPGTFGPTCAGTCACGVGGVCDDGVDGTGACTCHDGYVGPSCEAIPTLALYTVRTDGTGLRLLLDTDDRELSHVRRLPGTDWLTATRYNLDPDGNGLAMENEEGFGAHYAGTEIVVFPMAAPENATVIAGTPTGGVAANSSWTDDGKLLFLAIPPGSGPTGSQIKRATFSSVPTVSSIAVIPIPSQLMVPVDPHQVGPSDSSGKLVLSAIYRQMPEDRWMRPVWLLPASGEAVWSATTLVGCPLCTGGCCGWSTPDEVLGTNDARINHAGTVVNWMQQSPGVTATVGSVVFSPYRQQMRTLSQPLQSDVSAVGVAPTTSLTFGEWRADDQELVYWSIELQGSVVRNELYRMTPDGNARKRIPLPRELCPLHPTYLGVDEIVFNAWRCVGPDCSCDLP